MSNVITMDTMRNNSLDNIIQMYRQGYRIDDSIPQYVMSQGITQIAGIPIQDLQTQLKQLQSTTSGTNIIVIIIAGILILAIGYYMLVLRFKIESAAARRAGVPYTAMGTTGTRGGLFG